MDFTTYFKQRSNEHQSSRSVEKTAQQRLFENSTMTADHFKEIQHTLSTKEQKETIPKFLAIVSDYYVVRVATAFGGVSYQEYIKKTDMALARGYFNYVKEVKKKVAKKRTKKDDDDDDDDNEDSEIKTVDITVKQKPMDWIRNEKFQSTLAKYSDMSIVSNDPKVLQLFIPPTITADKDMKYAMAKSFINDFKDRVVNTDAYDFLINTVAYKLHHLSEECGQLCFIQYSKHGGTGKSSVSKALGRIFWRYFNTGITDDQACGRFTGPLADLLFLWGEEWDKKNYQTRQIQTFIKRITTGDFSGERKGVDFKAASFKGIVGFNTNEPDLYGMTTASNYAAVVDRLCIIEYKADKENLTKQQWYDMLSKYGIEKGNPNIDSNYYVLAACLYDYLMNKHTIPSDFKPDRYAGADKLELLERLRAVCPQGADKFLHYFVQEIEEKNISLNEIVGRGTKDPSRAGVHYYRIKRVSLNTCFTEYIEKNKGLNAKLQFDTVVERMKDIGWVLIELHKTQHFEILKEKWDKYTAAHKEDVDSVSDEDDVNTESSDEDV